MHIVFLTSEYPKKGYPHGGVGTVIQNIARGLVQRQHQVSVLGLNYTHNDDIEYDEGVEIIRLKPIKVKFMSWYLNFKAINKEITKLHKNKPIDVIESTELGLAFINKIKGINYLIRLHGGHHFFAESERRKINFWKAYQEKRSFNKADHIIGVSEYVVNHTLKYINFKDKFKGVIYNLANLERFTSTDNSKEVKGRIFFAGSLCEKKGIRQLIQAMPKVIEAVPEAHLVVAGRDTIIRGTNNSYLNYLKSQIDDNLSSKIKFLGVVSNAEISKELEKAEVCAYPSHMEAMPLAWLEVLSMGKTLIASNLGPGSEVVINKRTGLLCNPFERNELASQIVKLLNDRDYAHELGKKAILDVNKRFGHTHLMQKNIELYTSLID